MLRDSPVHHVDLENNLLPGEAARLRIDSGVEAGEAEVYGHGIADCRLLIADLVRGGQSAIVNRQSTIYYIVIT